MLFGVARFANLPNQKKEGQWMAVVPTAAQPAETSGRKGYEAANGNTANSAPDINSQTRAQRSITEPRDEGRESKR